MTTRTKRILLGALVTLAVVVALGAYSFGYQHGVQVERRAWLATEQELPEPAPRMAAGRPAIQTSRLTRTVYRYPYSGQTFYASSGPPPVNRPDLRDTPTK